MAGEGEDARLVCTERVYFTCVGDVKVQNVAILQGSTPGWDTTPPGSVTGGEGCGTFDSALTNTTSPHNGHDGVWEDTFTGNLASMTVEIHKIDTLSRVDDREGLLLWIQVDGSDVVPRATTATIEVPGERSETGLTIKYEFSVANLPFVTQVGTGDVERRVMMSIRNFADYQGAWVWGASEVPSGVTFNPAQLSENVVSA